MRFARRSPAHRLTESRLIYRQPPERLPEPERRPPDSPLTNSREPLSPPRRFDKQAEQRSRSTDERILTDLEQRLLADAPQDKSREEFTEALRSAAKDRDVLMTVFALLARLLGTAAGERSLATPDLASGLAEAPGGGLLLANGLAGRLGYMAPGSPYVEDASLRPSPRETETPAEHEARVIRLAAAMKSGTSVVDLRSTAQAVIAHSNEIIDAPSSGTATRDTAEHDRSDALKNLAALEQIEAERWQYVNDLNRIFDFRRIAADLPGNVRQLVQSCRFELNPQLQVVLVGLPRNMLEHLQTVTPQGQFLEASPGTFLVGNTESTLVFTEDSGGTLTLSRWRGPAAWHPQSLE